MNTLASFKSRESDKPDIIIDTELGFIKRCCQFGGAVIHLFCWIFTGRLYLRVYGPVSFDLGGKQFAVKANAKGNLRRPLNFDAISANAAPRRQVDPIVYARHGRELMG